MESEVNAVPYDPTVAYTHPEHDCYAWQAQTHTLSREYTLSECSICRRITGFRWRKWHRRLISLFTDSYKVR
jgi:hypothetical protein